MERKNKCKKSGFSTILWAVAVILLCATPSLQADETVPAGEEWDIPGIELPDPIIGSLWVYGTANILPEADIGVFVYATDTSTVNITGGIVGWWIDVDGGANVTVCGTGFNLGEGTHTINGDVTGFYENGDPINLTFDCHDEGTVTLKAPGGPEEPIEVQIDIKPGSDLNPINPGSNGLIPVAILTTDNFDAVEVDPGTVTLAGTEVAVRGKVDKLMARMEDVDEDGDLDLLVQVDTQSEGAVWTSGPVTLNGKTYDGQDIEGTDDVIIAPPQEE